VQHCHLSQHAITGFVNDDTSRPIEYPLADNDAAAYRQAVHETAVTPGIFEPRLIDAPAIQAATELLVFRPVSVVLRRGPGLRVNDMGAIYGEGLIVSLPDGTA
jgi:hypothetical protein